MGYPHEVTFKVKLAVLYNICRIISCLKGCALFYHILHTYGPTIQMTPHDSQVVANGETEKIFRQRFVCALFMEPIGPTPSFCTIAKFA